MTKMQWLFLLFLLAGCGADNKNIHINKLSDKHTLNLPQRPYNLQLADTIDLFVWRARLLDTLDNICGEQLLIKNIDTTRLKSDAILWLGNGWDTVQLPRVQLLDKRAATLPRTAIIELWEDSLHSFRKRIEIPAGYDGVAFEVLRPVPKRILHKITMDKPITSVISRFVRMDILERDSAGIPTKGRAVYYNSPSRSQFADTITIQTASYPNFRCDKEGIWHDMDIPIQRPYQTTAVELHIESSELRYLPESEIIKHNFYQRYQYLLYRESVVDWELLGQLMALCDAKQYAYGQLERNSAMLETILDSLVVFQKNLIQFEKTKQLLPHISWGRSYIEVWRQVVEHMMIVLESSAQETINLQPKTKHIFENAIQKLTIIEMEAHQLPLEDYKKIYHLSGNLFPARIIVSWLEQEIITLNTCPPKNLAKCIAAIW